MYIWPRSTALCKGVFPVESCMLTKIKELSTDETSGNSVVQEDDEEEGEESTLDDDRKIA